ncbi:IS21-like element helper ATPase IstB [Myxococcus sp. NMCA1]|uniref:IS21-like element helper ATPase IstB n=1 Tax=Myxococcus sp. NMCA1 TaxID=2996785 RepID=UPI002285F024|nr:IS21-like element helper ATPase IstB [Myxococcus sp. NMCA1]WAM25553.1 IS21-like element helper ATPase IstB [Myxococcus sp. NMCA1]
MSPLKERLNTLGLHHTSAALDDLIALATKRRWGPTELLEAITEEETKDRARRSVERCLSRSKLGALRTMADFDWGWPKRIDRTAVEGALALDFMARPANVVLVAPQGLGKTMIAQNIAYNAVQAGHSVLFTTASQLLLDLGSQDSARALDRRLKHYCTQAGLLVIDEIGYLSYDARNADLLFQVVSRRYEKKPIVLTTNLPFSEWTTIFPNAACAIALIDRVIHHASIISIEGDSYRRRMAEESRAERKARKS